MAAGSLKLPQGNHAGCLSTTLATNVDFETRGDLSARQTRRDGALLLDRIAAGTITLKIQGKLYRAHGQGREKENIQRNKKALATSLPHRRNFWAHLAATIRNWPLQSVTTTPVHI